MWQRDKGGDDWRREGKKRRERVNEKETLTSCTSRFIACAFNKRAVRSAIDSLRDNQPRESGQII